MLLLDRKREWDRERKRRVERERARVSLIGFQDSTGNQGIATEINGKTGQTPGHFGDSTSSPHH